MEALKEGQVNVVIAEERENRSWEVNRVAAAGTQLKQ